MALSDMSNLLSSGTGFIYRKDGKHFLITNWHNVSGINPVTGKKLFSDGRIPDRISTEFREKGKPSATWREELLLYEDSTMSQPQWLEHPEFSHKVDVVALPIEEEISSRYQLYPINIIPFDNKFKEMVADDAFIIGFPFPDLTYLAMPIWKKASIATEPDIDLDQTPKMLVDTATRSGLSGSPVIMQRIGIHGMTSEKLTGTETIGRVRNFIGIYSGRRGEDEEKAQLGIVWKARVIDEIVAGNKKGKAPISAS